MTIFDQMIREADEKQMSLCWTFPVRISTTFKEVEAHNSNNCYKVLSLSLVCAVCINCHKQSFIVLGNLLILVGAMFEGILDRRCAGSAMH